MILINQLKDNINSLVLENMFLGNNDYEIVIAGTPNIELAVCINLESNNKFHTLKSTAFYIRPINFTHTNSTNLNPTSSSIVTSSECSICLRNFNLANLTPWASCTHYNNYCQSCISNWNLSCDSIGRDLNCPLCRQTILFA